jgi:hypothetical protein
MKDPRKNAHEDFEETQSLDEQIAADLVSDDTQRVRSLTVQEIERILKDKKRAE